MLGSLAAKIDKYYVIYVGKHGLGNVPADQIRLKD